MPKLQVNIPQGALADQVLDAILPTFTKLGVTAKARAQQIIGEEVKDRSGDLKSSISYDIEKNSKGFELILFSEGADPYAYYQHEGTGIYGPKKRMITPKRGKFLVWKDPDTDELIFAKAVRGVPAKKFLTRAMDFAIKRILK